MKRFLLLTLMVLSFSIQGFADVEFACDSIWYSITDPKTSDFCSLIRSKYKTAVSQPQIKYKGDIVIPDSVNYNGKKYRVAYIKDAFIGCNELTSVYIPSGIIYIYIDTFEGCTRLEKVVFEDGTSPLDLYVGYYSKDVPLFQDAPLKYVYMGREFKHDTSWRNNPFLANKTLECIEVGPKVKNFYSNNPTIRYTKLGLEGCSSLKKIIVRGNGVELNSFPGLETSPVEDLILERGANISVPNLKKVEIGPDYKDIIAGQFSGCKVLEEITFPETVVSLGKNTFKDCESLSKAILNEGLKYIRENAFEGCKNLNELNIPSTMIEIGDYAFSKTGISDFNIPIDVKTIGKYVYSECDNLKSVKIPYYFTSIPDFTFYKCKNLASVDMAATVANVGSNAFEKCESLSEVFMPKYLKHIGKAAFSECTSLQNITIPDSIVNLESTSFYGCSNLATINIPAKLESIGSYCFANCKTLNEINIPVMVSNIGECAFSGCQANIKLTPCLPQDILWGIDRAYQCLKGLDVQQSVVYTHRSEKDAVSEYWSGKTIYFEDVDFKDQQSYLGGVDFSLIEKQGGLSFPIKNISYANVATPSETSDIPLNTDNIYSIRQLQPEETYYIFIEDQNGINTYALRTNDVEFDISAEATQSTIKWYISPSNDETVNPVWQRYADYPDIEDFEMGEFYEQTGLLPGKTYGPTDIWTEYNGKRFLPSTKYDYKITTLPLNIRVKATATPTKIIFAASWDEGDAQIYQYGFSQNKSTDPDYLQLGKDLVVEMEPGRKHQTYFGVRFYRYSSISEWVECSAITPELTWGEGDYTAVSTSAARLLVETNCDAETGTGFEWRRNDSPEEMKSTYVACPVVDGHLVGMLRNLNPEVYYKFRPVYESSKGNKYYGEWTVFFTGDANVYFEPEVRTLGEVLATDNSATVSTYVMPGSDELTGQGIQYWKKSDSTRREETIMEIATSGIKSTVEIPDLEAGSEYIVRAFAETATGRVYGQEVAFTTSGTASIDFIEISGDSNPKIYVKRAVAGMPLVFRVCGFGDSKAEVLLTSMTGATVYRGWASDDEGWTAVECRLQPGIYMLTAMNGKRKAAVKAVVK